ncbi:glycosyltransferase [Novispirillum sp. DQ9]|uniref:glycosyltransferase n=1 Tax=Novispirillum sp. DQ9 TaxID=3398612 RepID=UPI003C7AA359
MSAPPPGSLRVLMVHARYRQPGGEDVSVEAEVVRLREAGVIVDPLIFGPLPDGAGLEALWNDRAAQALRQRLTEVPADLIHVQNVFPAGSAAVLKAAVGSGLPVVHTLRNHRLVCPAGTLWRPGKGRCRGPSCLSLGCWRGSRLATAGAMAATALLRWSGALDGVTRFITPSAYLRDALAAAIDPARVRVVPNLLAEDPGVGIGRRSGIVYAGRLVEEKGLADLLPVARRLGPEAPITLIGDGPFRTRLRDAPPWLVHLPHVPHAEVLQAMREAAVVVLPSLWAEPFGRAALEGMACGAAVVASRVGGLPEVVGDAGILVDPGHRAALAHALHEALEHAPALGAKGRRRYEALSAGGVEPLLAVYEEAMAAHPRRRSHPVARAANSGTVRP